MSGREPPSTTSKRWKDLKDAGNKAFNDGYFKNASFIYSEAIVRLEDLLFQQSQSGLFNERDEHNLAVLYGNRAECWFRLRDEKQFLADARKSVDYDPNWYKGHWRVGRAFQEQKKWHKACRAFLNALKTVTISDGKDLKETLLVQLIETIYPEKEQHYVMKKIEGISSETWAKLSYKFIVKEKWNIAEFVYKNITKLPCSMQGVELSPFCHEKLLDSQKHIWICGLLLSFLTSGSDHRTLKFHRGDTYLHATVSILVKSGSSPHIHNSEPARLLSFMMNKKVIPNKEQNLLDDKRNTVLHHLASLKGSMIVRGFLAEYLIENGVDVMAQNKEHQKAVDLVRDSDQLIEIFHRYMSQEPVLQRRNEARITSQGTIQLGVNGHKKISVQQKHDNCEENQLIRECDHCEELLRQATDNEQEKNYTAAYKNLVTVVKKSHHVDPRHKIMKDCSIEKIANLLACSPTPDIPQVLTRIAPGSCKEVLNMLAKAGKWKQLLMLVSEFRRVRGQHELPNFAKSVSLLSVIKDASLCQNEDAKIELIDLLSSSGATMDPDTSFDALQETMKNSEWQVALKLLELKASPESMTLVPGDTPYHVALCVALTKDPGNFAFLDKLKHLQDSDAKKYPFLSLSCQDTDGNTLLHLATKAKFSEHSLIAVEKLCSWGVPVDLQNKKGKLPHDYLPSEDRRAQYLTNGASCKANQGNSGMAMRPAFQEVEEIKNAPPVQNKASSKSNSKIPESSLQRLLSAIPDQRYNYLISKKEKANESYKENDPYTSEEEKESPSSDDSCDSSDGENAAQDSVYGDWDLKKCDKDGIDVEAFDISPWEVECTEEVWNILRGRKKHHTSNRRQKKCKEEEISNSLKLVIIKHIQLLASGNWESDQMQPVEQVPDSTIRLYKIGLPHGACVLWELAVAFSPRLNQPEQILALYTNELLDKAALSNKQVYSDIIRVWSIVLKESDQNHAVQKIVMSHQRGKSCIIKRTLKGINECNTALQSPMLYSESDAVAKEPRNTIERQLYPPAVSNKNEYHIVKFYTFSSTLVSALLEKSHAKIDFPFRVTDLEHAFIKLQVDYPLLLIGRSGTGKTTCCLYRMWNEFLSYWKKAAVSKSPLLPRERVPPNIEDSDGADDEINSDNNTEQISARQATSKVNQEELEYQETLVTSLEDFEMEEEQAGADESSVDVPVVQYDHIHQLLVTKNPVLCSGMKKNFKKLCRGSNLSEINDLASNVPLPYTLQDIDDSSFPLFLTLRQLLLMLDASLEGDYYFPRNEDLALKDAVHGWSMQEDDDGLELSIFLDSSDEDETESQRRKNKMEQNIGAHGMKSKVKKCSRQECTYEIFAVQVWPKISRCSKIDCHPALVWTEILSFIKGSFEALHTEKGYLDLNEYQEIGHKRAQNFSGDRCQIYKVFLSYQQYLQNHSMFDEADLVFKLYKRHLAMNFSPWVLHEIYVDETQDFTQGELALLISLSENPNKMFLTGDTAQSIMRGISFRFCDLQSLFFFARQSAKKEQPASKLQMPKKVHQLVNSYRSHAGILSLGSAVLDILVALFPESFDQLEKDKGMFPGPKPVIIESCSPEDLALLLTGNRKETSHIEFGAHQAVLVTSEKAKANLPKDLTTGLVLSIYESKGLEFDDILIYNFFKDSSAQKEWRVVTEVLEKMVKASASTGNKRVLEIDADVLDKPNRPRAVQFDAKHHKVLNTELKQLYTAITRARVNVWIFDEDSEIRAPMFEYFLARKLVKLECKREKEHSDLNEIMSFAERSSPKEWKLEGDGYMKKKLFAIAAQCYKKAERPDKEKLAQAYQTAQEAAGQKLKSQYMKAAEQFIQCGELLQGAICLRNAGEYFCSALAFQKNGQFEEASDLYIRSRNILEASRCLEMCGKFGRAVRILAEAKLFKQAIDSLHKFEEEVEKHKKDGKPLPVVLIENRPSDKYSESNLYYRAAEYHANQNDKAKALAAIQQVKDIWSQIIFMKEKDYWVEAAEILREKGKTEEAAQLMLNSGQREKALECAEVGFHKSLEAFIHLVLARSLEMKGNLEESKTHAQKSLTKYIELKDYDGMAKSKTLLGKLKEDIALCREAYFDFGRVSPPNTAGRMENFSIQLTLLRNITTVKTCQDILKNIKDSIDILTVLLECWTKSSVRCIKFLQFYGLELDGNERVAWYPQHLSATFLNGFVKEEKKELKKITMKLNKVRNILASHVFQNIKCWAEKARETLNILKLDQEMLFCSRCHAGLTCTPQCHVLKRPTKSIKEDNETLELLCCFVSLDYHVQTNINRFGSMLQMEVHVNETSRWQSVIDMLHFLFPTGILGVRSEAKNVNRLISSLRKNKDVVDQIKRYFEYLWNHPARVAEGKSKSVTKERCKSTDWTVQACFFASLLKFDKDLNVEVHMRKLEEDLMHNFRKWFFKRDKYALFAVKDKGRCLQETIGQRFVESFKQLTGPDLNPYESVYTFTKVISTLGNRGQLPLMPQMEHLIFWLEFYFLLTWVFMAKANQDLQGNSTFYMSNAFLSSLHLINLCMDETHEQASTLQELIAQSVFFHGKPDHLVKNMLERQAFLANFLVGHNRYSKFSLISCVNILCKEEKPHCIMLAERILLMAAVIMLNIPDGYVLSKYEIPIRREMFKIEIPLSIPLTTFLNKLKQATNYSNIFEAAVTFLKQRNGSTLMKCRWIGRDTCPMKWTEVSSSDYIDMDFYDVNLQQEAENTSKEAKVTTALISEEHTASSHHEEAAESDILDDEDVKRMKAKQEEMTNTKREREAIQIIIRILKIRVMSTRLREKAFYKYELEEMFKDYTLNDSYCGVCGIDLKQNDNLIPGDEGFEEKFSKDVHKNFPTHKDKLRDLNAFKKLYTQKIHEPLEKIKCFLAKYRVKDSDTYAAIKPSISHLLESLNDFEKSLMQIMSNQDWSNQTNIHDAFCHLETCFIKYQAAIVEQYKEYEIEKAEADQPHQYDREHEETMAASIPDLDLTDAPDEPMQAKDVRKIQHNNKILRHRKRKPQGGGKKRH